MSRFVFALPLVFAFASCHLEDPSAVGVSTSQVTSDSDSSPPDGTGVTAIHCGSSVDVDLRIQIAGTGTTAAIAHSRCHNATVNWVPNYRCKQRECVEGGGTNCELGVQGALTNVVCLITQCGYVLNGQYMCTGNGDFKGTITCEECES